MPDYVGQHETWLPFLVVLASSFVAAVHDVTSGRVPNLLTIPLFIAALAWTCWLGGIEDVCESVFASALTAGPFLLLFIVGVGGAGDAKMMGALGAWLGLWNGVLLLLSVLTVGALGGIAYALATRQAKDAAGRMGRVSVGLLMLVTPMRRSARPFLLDAQGKGVPMPYGVAIFGGACVAALASNWWSSLL